MRRPTLSARLSSGARRLLPLLAVVGLFGCETPPPEAYLAGGPRGDRVPVGRNSVGDVCYQYRVGQDGGVDIYCGTWSQPAGRVRPSADAASLDQQALVFAASMAPRITDCGTPQPFTFTGADQALRMTCARGRWSHAAMVVRVAGRVYYADGMEAVVPSLQRSIGVLAGRAQPLPAEEGARKSVGRRPDPNDFQGLMLAGSAANREGFSEEAADHFRAAVALQDRAAKKDDWGLSSALIALGVQLSNQGKFTEADAIFARASEPRLLRSAALSQASFNHYKAMHLLNIGVARKDKAMLASSLELMRSAERDYLANLPPGAALASPNTELMVRFAPITILSQLGQGQQTFGSSRSDLETAMGVIETRRGQALILRAREEQDEALTVALSAEEFARSRGLTLPKVAAFFYRTTGMVMLSGGQAEPSADRFELSVEAFRQGWRTTPTPKAAQTQLRRAEALLRTGDTDGTLQSCRDATEMLTTLRQGVETEMLQPCLAAYARRLGPGRDDQALLREMFLTAQLSRASATANLAQRAAIRLGADPKIANELAIRDGANAELNDLRERRAKLSGSEAAAIDKRIEAVQADLHATETNLQDALPNYHALLEPFATADQVFAVLRPNEALASINLAATDGWVFLLRDNRIRLGRIEGGNQRVGELVAKLRASIEPTGSSAPPPYDVATAHQLYTAVLGGVAQGLDGATELSVAPVGKLLSIPFQVLLTDPFNGANLSEAPFLVKKLTITHVPSASNLLRLRQSTAPTRTASGAQTTPAALPARRPWFGFGSSTQITPAMASRLYPTLRCGDNESARRVVQLPVLPGAARELNAVRQLMRAAPNEELIGQAFTRSATLSRSLGDYRVLHFASHALLQSDIACLEEPAIVTSIAANDPKPELLTATDILSRMRLSADVVVLSACNTGGGSGKDGGESLSGLAKSFFFAGARALMVTHWAVDDLTNVRLVVEALDGMRDSPIGALSPALQRAQIRMLSTPGYEHPFFWAPMIVLGEGGGRPGSGSASGFRSAGL